MLRRPPARLPIFIALPVIGLLAGLALAVFFSLPQVTAFSPAAGAQLV